MQPRNEFQSVGLMAVHTRAFFAFCEQLGAAVLDLPRTAPPYARELWHDVRTGDPATWIALSRTFIAAMFLLSIGLWASAVSG